MINEQPTLDEVILLNHLKIGIENPTKKKVICFQTGLSERKFFKLIQDLRSKGYPIGSDREKPGTGYFIARNEDELGKTKGQYLKQITTSQDVLKELENADFSLIDNLKEEIANG